MIRGKLFMVTFAALFLIRLVFQSQIVVPFYECAWPGTTGLFSRLRAIPLVTLIRGKMYYQEASIQKMGCIQPLIAWLIRDFFFY